MLYYFVILFCIIFDQLTKIIIKSNYHLGEEVPILSPYINWYYTTNDGIAFGFPIENQWFRDHPGTTHSQIGAKRSGISYGFMENGRGAVALFCAGSLKPYEFPFRLQGRIQLHGFDETMSFVRSEAG